MPRITTESLAAMTAAEFEIAHKNQVPHLVLLCFAGAVAAVALPDGGSVERLLGGA
jgi:hypothetical protein